MHSMHSIIYVRTMGCYSREAIILASSFSRYAYSRLVEVREIHSMHTGVLGSYCTIRSTTSRMHKNSYMVWHMHTTS